ncbi:MAG: hypothetical protein PWQ88_563 [Candidatus Methanomethylophilaceae archaeon]|nr:hypothetical protein [Candidatus Methanomethylophilaceae archaeon]MDI3541602.1 hypothetical protein [Candidatus Methanomethylophilaceae archaeon]
MECETDLTLIVTVVKKGWGEVALKASIDAGAQGGTILYGRGIGLHERRTILGMRIEPEKEILMTAIKRSLSEQVMNAIKEAIELDKPGQGISMLVPLEKVIGRVHMTPEEDTYYPLLTDPQQTMDTAQKPAEDEK